MATSKVSLKLLIDKKGHKALNRARLVGCLGNLYKSFNELDESYIRTSQIKESILKPTVSISATEIPLLLLSDELPSKLYRCQYCNKYVAKEPNVLWLVSCSARGHGRSNVPSNEKGFVKGVVTYMVMDNLEVSPMSSISSITLLNQFKIQDLSVLEERVVDLGMDEALKLLKESLQSKTVLTRVFLGTMKKLGCY
ncbi:hypothetical protein GH714_029923 [Hevea brasiliensis]|uniref:Uncharacterized protein n=1 Tax=Hevea brasiliensis TaxID=3981 RepID=A0A6A6KMP2_HEVBR|nr:hypothetical protein GH714_029923 [Hevea brasiliensis]